MSSFGTFAIGFVGGAANKGEDIMEQQRKYEIEQAAQQAELERKKSLTAFTDSLKQPQRDIDNKLNERRVAVQEGQLGIQQQSVNDTARYHEGQLAISRENAAYRRKADSATLSGQWGKDPVTGEVRQLTREEAMSGKFQLASQAEVATKKAKLKLGAENTLYKEKFQADSEKLKKLGNLEPTVYEEVVKRAELHGILPTQELAMIEQAQKNGYSHQDVEAAAKLTEKELAKIKADPEVDPDEYALTYDRAYQANLKKITGDKTKRDPNKVVTESIKQQKIKELEKRYQAALSRQKTRVKKIEALRADGKKIPTALQKAANKEADRLIEMKKRLGIPEFGGQ